MSSKPTYTFCHWTDFIHNYHLRFCLFRYLTELSLPLARFCLIFVVNLVFIVRVFIVRDGFIPLWNCSSQQIIILVFFFWSPTVSIVFRSFRRFARIFIEGYDCRLRNCWCAARSFSYRRYSFNSIQIMYLGHGRCLLVSPLNPNLVKVLQFYNRSMCKNYSVLFIFHSLEHIYLWNWFIMELSILEIK